MRAKALPLHLSGWASDNYLQLFVKLYEIFAFVGITSCFCKAASHWTFRIYRHRWPVCISTYDNWIIIYSFVWHRLAFFVQHIARHHRELEDMAQVKFSFLSLLRSFLSQLNSLRTFVDRLGKVGAPGGKCNQIFWL